MTQIFDLCAAAALELPLSPAVNPNVFCTGVKIVALDAIDANAGVNLKMGYLSATALADELYLKFASAISQAKGAVMYDIGQTSSGVNASLLDEAPLTTASLTFSCEGLKTGTGPQRVAVNVEIVDHYVPP